jgi:hypothetical protein
MESNRWSRVDALLSGGKHHRRHPFRGLPWIIRIPMKCVLRLIAAAFAAPEEASRWLPRRATSTCRAGSSFGIAGVDNAAYGIDPGSRTPTDAGLAKTDTRRFADDASRRHGTHSADAGPARSLACEELGHARTWRQAGRAQSNRVQGEDRRRRNHGRERPASDGGLRQDTCRGGRHGR